MEMHGKKGGNYNPMQSNFVSNSARNFKRIKVSAAAAITLDN